jgi:hypothetical protein
VAQVSLQPELLLTWSFPYLLVVPQLERSCLAEFMPSLAQKALARVLDDAFPGDTAGAATSGGLRIETRQSGNRAMMSIGRVEFPIMTHANQTKVPKVRLSIEPQNGLRF